MCAKLRIILHSNCRDLRPARLFHGRIKIFDLRQALFHANERRARRTSLHVILLARLMPHQIQDYLDLAIQVAREAGDHALAVNRSELQITTKSNAMDIVTEVDGRNERKIRETVLAKYPDHSFLGEETGASAEGASGVRWIVDPIDGTVNYAHGLPVWC